MAISQFLDLDLEDARPDEQGSGFIEQDPDVFRTAVVCEDFEKFAREMIPRSMWKEECERMENLLRNSVRETKNQGREGSCVGAGTTGGMQVRSFIQFGEKLWRPLSTMSLYNRIGRSASSGAYIPDGINEAADEGVLPRDTEENRNLYTHVYRERGFVGERRMNNEAPNWQQTGKLFKIARVRRINTVDAWVSALLQGFPIVYGRDSHCIYSLFPKYHRGDLYFGYINSWGQWGDHVNDICGKGLGWDSERKVRRCVGYAIEEIVVRPAEMKIAA